MTVKIMASQAQLNLAVRHNDAQLLPLDRWFYVAAGYYDSKSIHMFHTPKDGMLVRRHILGMLNDHTSVKVTSEDGDHWGYLTLAHLTLQEPDP